MRNNLRLEEQIEFLQQIIMDDIKHLKIQEEKLNQFIQQSILSLIEPETSLFEELRDEYKQKAVDNLQILDEINKTYDILKDSKV